MSTPKEPNFSSNSAAADSLGKVRKRGVFVMEALLWAAAGGFMLILGGYFVALLNFAVSGAERFRRILGGSAPATGPDWYAITVIGLGVLLPVGLLGALFVWYRGGWKKRLKSIWRQDKDLRRFARIQPIPKSTGVGDLKERTAYLKLLLCSDEWRPCWPAIQKEAGITDFLPESLSSKVDKDYELVATAVWNSIQADIKDRALATGLIVGLSGNRWMDQITILVASLELQLQVLTRLGKKPNWHTWRMLLERMLSSLFLNTYLTRQDAFSVQILITKTAMGLQVLSDLAEQGAEHLKNIDVEHLLHNSADMDETLEDAHHLSGHTGGAFKTAGRAFGKAADIHAGGLGTLVAEGLIAGSEYGAKAGLAMMAFLLRTGATGLHLIVVDGDA